MTAGHNGGAIVILVIPSLCLHIRWHGSQTFTAGWRIVFRKEVGLLQRFLRWLARLPGDILWFDFTTRVNIRLCAVSLSKWRRVRCVSTAMLRSNFRLYHNAEHLFGMIRPVKKRQDQIICYRFILGKTSDDCGDMSRQTSSRTTL